jgi:ribosome assembly protein 4
LNDLKGHAHWVNTLALSSDFVLELEGDQVKMKAYAQDRYNKIRDPRGEKLVSGSDDNTMMMWEPKT